MVIPGELKSRRHINLPGVKVNLPSFTEKDRADATVGLEEGIDFLALSFVREAADIELLRIDDDLLDKVRVLAAMKRTSVNEMVRGFLTRLVEEALRAGEDRHDLLFERHRVELRLLEQLGQPRAARQQRLRGRVEVGRELRERRGALRLAALVVAVEVRQRGTEACHPGVTNADATIRIRSG